MSILARARKVVNAFVGGVFALLWNLFLILLMWALMQSAIGHLRYLLADAPVLMQRVDEAMNLKEDDPFLIRLPLDWRHGMQIESRDTDYTLVPVAGSGGRLIVAREGHAQESERQTLQTLRGRAIGRGLFGDWDAGEMDSTVHLQSEFRRIGLEVPDNALLLVVDWHFTFDEYWQMALGLVAFVILLVLAARALMAVRRRLAAEG